MPQYPGPDLPPNPTAAARKRHSEAFQRWVAEEQARVRRQRAHLGGRGPVRKALIRAMLGRAWELLDAGDAEAADALLEFVPEAAAELLLELYFREDV